MRISTKGRYAVRVMVDIATNEGADPIKLKDIAARQALSEKYLEQIIAILNKGGYVKSIRGAKGGYRLANSADSFTVGMILRLTEGSLSPVACVDRDKDECNRCDTCETISLWKELSNAINQVVDGTTIQDLVRKKAE